MGSGEVRAEKALDDTRLMFVGEDLEVLSIASKHPEKAQDAPAIAQVLPTDKLKEQGIFTVGEALSTMPGFYILPKEWGDQPYLRGLSDSFLFLYDGVPLTTDSTKSIFPLGRELSLDLTQRLEVVRGPGSVLWGPDAFAGVVNVAPLNGRDAEGLWAQAVGGNQDDAGLTLRYGKAEENWDGFIGANYYTSKYWDPDFDIVRLKGEGGFAVPFEERFGSDEVDRDQYVELTTNFRYGDWLRLSGRFSDYVHHFTFDDSGQDFIWSGERSTPFSLIKLELNKQLEGASLRLNSYYNHFKLDNREIDLDSNHQNDVGHVELLYDQELLQHRALMTVGASYRYNQASNVALDQVFVPDFLSPENKALFVPRRIIEDYNTDLMSLFGQFRAHTNRFDAWAGARIDEHNQYGTMINFSGGLTGKWRDHSTWKLLYGTAFRTPFAKQFFEEEEPEPEQIRSLNAQWIWEPKGDLRFSTTGFVNWLDDHISEDPFGGLSTPSSQTIYGLELEGRWNPLKNFTLWANAGFQDHDGDDLLFRVEKFTFIGEDGTIIKVFEDFTKPFEISPHVSVNTGAIWKPNRKWTFSGRLSYYSEQDFTYLKGFLSEVPSEKLESDDIWLLNLSGIWNWKEHLRLGVSLKNVINLDAEIPGTYGLKEYPPIQAIFWMNYKF